MAPFGVCIGLLITNIGDGNTMEAPIVVLESIATGTFLYVTFLELVPHEFIGEGNRFRTWNSCLPDTIPDLKN